jgi:hypothetical protein
VLEQEILEEATKQLAPEFDVVGIVSDGRALVQMALKLKLSQWTANVQLES